MQRSVLISGGMGGIGRAIALRFAADGYRVCVLYHHTALQDVDAFMRELGSEHLAIRCDITDARAVRESVQKALDTFGSLQAFIHTATGLFIRKGLMDTADDEFRAQFDVPVFGGFNLLQTIVPHFVDQRGGVVVALTTAALEGESGGPLIGYLSAKASLRGLLKEVHREYHSEGLRVMALAPGFVATALHKDLPRPVFEFLKEREPNRATPEQVAAFLAKMCDASATEFDGQSCSIVGGELVASSL